MNTKHIVCAATIFAAAATVAPAGTLDTETTFEDPIVVEDQSRGSGLGTILIPVLVLGGVAAAVALGSNDGT